MVVLIPYISLLELSCIRKCLFWKNVEPLIKQSLIFAVLCVFLFPKATVLDFCLLSVALLSSAKRLWRTRPIHRMYNMMFVKTGGYQKALKDFKSLKPTNVQTIGVCLMHFYIHKGTEYHNESLIICTSRFQVIKSFIKYNNLD